MPTTISKDGNRCTTIEWEVREIDQYGDAQDINHFESFEEAKPFADDLTKRVPAVVIERHVSKRPAHLFGDPDTYSTVWTAGNQDALREGGWIE
jgi:hypothetical protein